MKQHYSLFFIALFVLIVLIPFAVRAVTIEVSAVVPGCGDGIIANGEQCDTATVGGASCQSLGFSKGTLSCTSACTFNTTECSSDSVDGTGDGGGGGGSGPSRVSSITGIPDTNVVFSGRAYPFRPVSILKDGQVAVKTIAGADGTFTATISDVSTGWYTFVAYAEDKNSVRSSLFTFPMNITSGVTTKIGAIFITPTIALDKNEVKQGDSLSISGQSIPSALVSVVVNADHAIVLQQTADADGAYTITLTTASLPMGQYTVAAKATVEGETTSFGKVVSFIVGTKNESSPRSYAVDPKFDLDSDGAVNLADYSIMAYWYKRPTPPTKVDLNGDGRVDLIDLSILAYYWTG